MFTVYKFGGASIKDVNSIYKVGKIINSIETKNLVVVFSAMGKVTNMLEKVVDAYYYNKKDLSDSLNNVKKFHLEIINHLFEKNHRIFDYVNNLFVELDWELEGDFKKEYDYIYDQVVSVGELLSTRIMSSYLLDKDFNHQLLDARDFIKTDNNFRNAKIDWQNSKKNIEKVISKGCYVTQGFIGCTSENFTTTLGREGSDFSASIIAFLLDANNLVIWKDVLGMMNADPRYFSCSKLVKSISYDEAIELAYFGAKVIHPKTIQPLKKKNIPLHIRSFLNLTNSGTKIFNYKIKKFDLPFYILKKNQILISIADPNLSFIVEDHISKIFSFLSLFNIRVNLMQNSAVSFSICVDNDTKKINSLFDKLSNDFKISYNENVFLYTVRHYTLNKEDKFLIDKKILIEQRTRNNLQLVLSSN